MLRARPTDNTRALCMRAHQHAYSGEGDSFFNLSVRVFVCVLFVTAQSDVNTHTNTHTLTKRPKHTDIHMYTHTLAHAH